MLFRRNIEPNCAYCKHGKALGFEEILCKRRGIMMAGGRCSEFRYEPTKRKPEYVGNAQVAEVLESELSI